MTSGTPIAPIRGIGLALALGVAVATTLVVVLSPGPFGPLPAPVTALVTAVATLLVGVGIVIGLRGPRDASRKVLGFALCEAAGLLGVLLTILTGNPVWAIGYGAVAVAGILVPALSS